MRRLNCPVRVSGGFLLLLAFLLFLDSSFLLPHFLMACLVHELGHYAVLRASGGRIRAVRLTAAGAEMELCNPAALSYPEELAAVLAGPAAGLALAFIAAWIAGKPGWEELYVLAGISLTLSAFNLLPVRALDGGQAVYLLLSWLTGPVRAEAMARKISLVTALILTAAGSLAYAAGGGCALLLAAVILSFQSLNPQRVGRLI